MEEWSEWFEHDGKGCPCVGQYVQCIAELASGGGRDVFGIASGSPLWDWSNFGKPGEYRGQRGIWARAIRYRIRRPKGIAILENMIADIPAPVAPEVVG